MPLSKADIRKTQKDFRALAKLLERRGNDWRKYDPVQGDNIRDDFRRAATYLRFAVAALEPDE